MRELVETVLEAVDVFPLKRDADVVDFSRVNILSLHV